MTALTRESSWEGVRALVAGFGVSGFAAADALTHVGASVVAIDEAPAEGERAEQATLLEILGAQVRSGPGSTSVGGPGGVSLDGFDVVIASPGWRPDSPVFVEASRREIPVWGEVELAWRLRTEGAAPWLVVTGTNGKTTTVGMLESMLAAAGLRAKAVGNIGTPIVQAVMDPDGFDVLAVELSSFQLHWPTTFAAESAVVLNVAPDHLDWHGGIEQYAAAKARVYENARVACVYNLADDRTLHMVEEADVQAGCRAIGFSSGIPAISELGVVDGHLVDRAFIPERAHSAAELGSVSDLTSAAGGEVAPHVIEDALAAAALARAHGVKPAAVRDGLRAYGFAPHRFAEVEQIGGVTYIDDSKATNTHAASTALASISARADGRIVWIAGGLAKGARFDELVRRHRDRLRAVVLIGADRDLIADALARHAPEVTRVFADGASADSLMDDVVNEASSLAATGDTVVLAPACASMDQFDDYQHRGRAFAQAVRRLAAD